MCQPRPGGWPRHSARGACPGAPPGAVVWPRPAPATHGKGMGAVAHGSTPPTIWRAAFVGGCAAHARGDRCAAGAAVRGDEESHGRRGHQGGAPFM